MAEGTQRLRLDLGYDGSGFAGWARQPATRTVQGVVEEALARLTRVNVAVTVAGRTDAGVHAAGQVAHVDLAEEAWRSLAATALRRLNALLPDDVRLFAVSAVDDSFDARFSALSRTYHYRLCDAPGVVPPLRRYDTVGWRRPLELERLNAASAPLLGEHDFAAFCRRRDGATTIRRLLELAWRRQPDGAVVAAVRADAFCHSMVRSLVGALLAAGDGRRPVAWPASLLALRERSGQVTVAPPHGLILVAVEYPPAPQWASRAESTRRRRVPVDDAGGGRPGGGR